MVLHNCDIILMPEPRFLDVMKRFVRVADWESVCPYLLNDNDGEMTRLIKMNHDDIERRRAEMLERFFNNVPNPTWRHVLAALRQGNYEELANEIEDELQGWYMYIHNGSYF